MSWIPTKITPDPITVDGFDKPITVKVELVSNTFIPSDVFILEKTHGQVSGGKINLNHDKFELLGMTGVTGSFLLTTNATFTFIDGFTVDVEKDNKKFEIVLDVIKNGNLISRQGFTIIFSDESYIKPGREDAPKVIKNIIEKIPWWGWVIIAILSSIIVILIVVIVILIIYLVKKNKNPILKTTP